MFHCFSKTIMWQYACGFKRPEKCLVSAFFSGILNDRLYVLQHGEDVEGEGHEGRWCIPECVRKVFVWQSKFLWFGSVFGKCCVSEWWRSCWNWMLLKNLHFGISKDFLGIPKALWECSFVLEISEFFGRPHLYPGHECLNISVALRQMSSTFRW